MTPEEQEALSIRYARGWWVVPLSTGRLAVFTHPMGELVDIVEPLALPQREVRTPDPVPAVGLDLEVEL